MSEMDPTTATATAGTNLPPVAPGIEFANTLPIPGGGGGGDSSSSTQMSMPGDYREVVNRSRTINLGGQDISCDVGRDLFFSEQTLPRDMQMQANLYERYSSWLADAEEIAARAKYDIERLESEGINRARIEIFNQMQKMPTDTQAMAYAKSRPEYDQARRKLLQAEDTVRRLKNITRSLEHKRSMMESMAYQQRQIMRSLETGGRGAYTPSSIAGRSTRDQSGYTDSSQ